MRAVVRRNKQLVCADIEDLTPGPGQVLAKTLCCGICGSDLHALHSFEHMLELGQRSGGGGVGGGIDPSADIVFGHEFCAEILDHGPGSAKTLKAGTRVVTVPVMMTATGVDTIGYSNRYPGGFSERMLLSEPMLLEVPNGLSATQAAMTEPFAVGEHAVAQSAAGPDASLLVVGCGPVGLAVIAALKSRGLGPIVAADFSPARRALAEVMGADEGIDPGELAVASARHRHCCAAPEHRAGKSAANRPVRSSASSCVRPPWPPTTSAGADRFRTGCPPHTPRRFATGSRRSASRTHPLWDPCRAWWQSPVRAP